MWWLLLLAGNEIGAHDVRLAPPPVPAANPQGGPPRLIDAHYDLGGGTRGGGQYRLSDLDPDMAPRRSSRPLAVTAIDSERQRLVIGVKPSQGKNKLGVAYRLRFGR